MRRHIVARLLGVLVLLASPLAVSAAAEPASALDSADGIAPPAPAALEAATGNKVVGLTWSHSDAADRAGYRIYRSTVLPVPSTGTPINGSLVTDQFYKDSARTNGTTYHYVVVAVDTSGHVSGPSPTASARPATAASPSGASITWLQRASNALARAEAGGVAIGGELYVFGGQFTGAAAQTLRSDRYNPATDTWTRLADLPEPITHAPVVADGTTAWILGGQVGVAVKDSSDRVWKYDTVTDSYTPGPPLPAPRGSGGAALVGRQLHYFSGAVRMDSTASPRVDHPDHWVLDLDGGTSWSTSTPVSNPRNHIAAVALQGKIYLVGGQHGDFESTTPQSQVDAFDVAAGTFTRVADLPVPRGHVSASTFVSNGKILVLGGSVLGAVGSRTIYEYDPAANRWTTRTNLPEAVRSPVADLIDGKIIVSGGRTAGLSAKTWSGSTGTSPPSPPPSPTASSSPSPSPSPSTPPPSGLALRYSTSATRSPPVDLAGATTTGSIYVVVTPDTGVSQVTWYLDDPAMTGVPRRTESGAPFDFAGGTVSTPTPFNTATVTGGSHTITAAVLTASGTTALSSTFTVDNGVPPPPPPVPGTRKVDFTTSTGPLAAGYLRDSGQPYAARSGTDQGTGLSFGWIDPETGAPLNLTMNPRDRSSQTTTSDLRQKTLMQMQYEGTPTSGTPIPGSWELEVADGTYQVTVGVGDAASNYTSSHHVNVEGQNAVAAFLPTSGSRLTTAVRTVWVGDGRLTLSATGGSNTKITFVDVIPVEATSPARPRVTTASPANSITDVLADAGVTTELLLPNGGLAASTVTSDTVRLTRVSDGTLVAANVNTSGGGDVIALTPASPLTAETWFRFDVGAGVQDVAGQPLVPWSHVFKTGGGSGATGLTGVAFDKVATTATGRMYTSVVIGPDHRLYAGTIDGVIWRFPINADGTLGTGQAISVIKTRAGGPRTIIGMVFDPISTPADPVLWVTDNAPYLGVDDVPDWEGKIVRLSGVDLDTAQDWVVGLPRSNRDHESNSLAFGPDGALYLTQGSNTAMGAPDAAWGNRPERVLSGAVLRINLASMPVSLPLDVKSEEGGTYDPLAIGAPVTLFATGVRNAFDLVWHSNGELYVPTNGSAAGGNTPATPVPLPAPCANRADAATSGAYTGPDVPALVGNREAESDWVFRVHAGGYYGHPAPIRCEWVLNGGNPTSSKDQFQVAAYPVGTMPDRNYRAADAYDMGLHASADGAIEYRSTTFGGRLQGRLLVVRYSVGDDIVALDTSGTAGAIVGRNTGIVGMTGFNDPLDLVEDTVNGNLYVTELGASRITLLRPRLG